MKAVAVQPARPATKPEKPVPSPSTDHPDKPSAPTCCQTCDYYMPKAWMVAGRQCAVFGTVDGVRHNRCGVHSPKPI